MPWYKLLKLLVSINECQIDRAVGQGFQDRTSSGGTSRRGGGGHVKDRA